MLSKKVGEKCTRHEISDRCFLLPFFGIFWLVLVLDHTARDYRQSFSILDSHTFLHSLGFSPLPILNQNNPFQQYCLPPTPDSGSAILKTQNSLSYVRRCSTYSSASGSTGQRRWLGVLSGMFLSSNNFRKSFCFRRGWPATSNCCAFPTALFVMQ